MKSYWLGTTRRRLFIVFVVSAVYIALLVIDGVRFFSQNASNVFSFAEQYVRFGFSALIAVLFLSVGSITWLYARNRFVAALLFCFTIASMISITVETAALLGDSLLSAIGGASSALLLLPLFALLLSFPKNHLSLYSTPGSHAYQKNKWQTVRLLQSFLAGFSILCGLSVVDYAYRYAQPHHVPEWLEVVGNVYFPLILFSILVSIPLSYFRSTSLRERQQVRFFLGGVVLALTPLLIFTVLPVVTAHPEYALDGQISTLFFLLLPLSLSYAVLRYQILIYDQLIFRTVTWIVGSIGIAVLSYVVVVVSNIAQADHLPLSLAYGVGCAAVLSPCLWWLATVGTERLLFRNEAAGYRRLLDTTQLLSDQKFDLERATELLVTSAQTMFETKEVCLFLRNPDSSLYFIYPVLQEGESNLSRHNLSKHLYPILEEHLSNQQVKQQVVRQLVSSRRPLLLSDITQAYNERRRIGYYLDISPSLQNGKVLLAPVRAQGEMIAILALGARTDRQSYAGPDFDVVQLLISRYAPILETARMTEQLRAAYERQKELDVLKDQFIMTASHELRTPLTAVLGYIGLLKEHNETLAADMRAKFIAKAELGCDELVLMVNNIMDASRLEVDVNNIKVIPVLLHKPVYHVVEIMDSIATRQHRSITVNVPSNILVLADTMRLHQVLLNLISNALKYSPPGTSIEVSAIADEGDEEDTVYATICVRDYGAGVPLESQNQLFERFMRLERDMNSPTRGAGLGLYICKQLVEAMSGNIWVESTGKAGEGSRFFFTLRLAPAQTQANTLEHQNLSALV